MERVTSPLPRSGAPAQPQNGVIYRKRTATSISYVQKLNSLLHIHLSVHPPHPGNTNSPKQSKPMETSYGTWVGAPVKCGQAPPSQSRPRVGLQPFSPQTYALISIRKLAAGYQFSPRTYRVRPRAYYQHR